ncbi:MAG: acyl-CoA thioesterase [Reyranellaceae bacterium]
MNSDPSSAVEAAIAPFLSRHEVTVEWGDCDPAGIVYYPAYFRWIDQATHRLFHNAGATREGTTGGRWTEGIPLVAAECSFRRASQPGEKLVVESHISRFGRSSFTIRHVFRDASGEVAAEGTETRIWARKEGDANSLKSMPIPADVRRRLGG